MRIHPFLWRSMLYVPGNQPHMIQKCMRYGADAVIIDLEDSVSVEEKEDTRILVDHALKQPMWDCSPIKTDLLIRINGLHTPYWAEDLEMAVPHQPVAIKIPKVESPDSIRTLDRGLEALEKHHHLPLGQVKLVLTIETAKAFLHLPELCACSSRIVGLGLGSEDLLTDTGIQREHLSFLRLQLVMIARPFDLMVLDSVFPDYHNPEGLRTEAQLAHSSGMNGKSAIHPDQIPILHQVFSPSTHQIEWAKEIVRQSGHNKGNAFSYKGSMVDEPILLRARMMLQRWEEGYE